MAKPLLPDALWERIEPLLPPPPPPKRTDRPGRDRVEDRKCLTGILFVLKTGINWEDLPCEMGCGCGMTCWRRLAEWTEAGVWTKLHELLLAELEYAGRIDWSRATIDSSHVRARGGGERTGPSPVNRRKKGSKHFVVTDGGGIPLATTHTAANYPDVKELEAAVDAIPPVRGSRGGRGDGRGSFMATGRWTRTRTAGGCDGVGSGRGSRDGGPSTAAGWGCTAGSASGRCPGCTTSVGCASGRTGRRRSIRHS